MNPLIIDCAREAVRRSAGPVVDAMTRRRGAEVRALLVVMNDITMKHEFSDRLHCCEHQESYGCIPATLERSGHV
jgi:hypothetical protein